ncbi:MAG: hypothetical protein JO335_02580 [Sphingomonas sp.]|nr:hypothetical protein [Sphingomonas sp.]
MDGARFYSRLVARAVVAAMVSATIAPSAAAGVHPPQVEQQLAFIAGDWTIKGLEANYRDHCTWFDANSFVVCDTDDRRHGTHHSIAVLGWSAAEGRYTYQQYDDSGRSRTERCYPNEQKGLTCLGEAHTKDGLVETRSYIWPTATGLGIRQEKSVNAGPWSDVGQVAYIRRLP